MTYYTVVIVLPFKCLLTRWADHKIRRIGTIQKYSTLPQEFEWFKKVLFITTELFLSFQRSKSKKCCERSVVIACFITSKAAL